MASEPFSPSIYTVRDGPVMLDGDLAFLYGVATGQFNRAIKRNRSRFPGDFAFQLRAEEWEALRCQIGILKPGAKTDHSRSQSVTLKSGRGAHRKYLPWVFTEHGAIMAATVLNSERAVAMSVYVVRAFVKIRRELLADATFAARLEKIEKTLLTHDSALRDLYGKLRPLLMPPPDPPKRRIGFQKQEKEDAL